MNLNSRYHLFFTLSLYVKLAQKQIDDEIWQLGLFLSSKNTVTRLFWGFSFANIFMKTWCSSCLKLLKVATMILSCHYRESLTWLLNTSEFLTCKKKKSLRVLTVAIRLWFPIRVAREVLLIHWSGNWPPISIHLEAERTHLS